MSEDPRDLADEILEEQRRRIEYYGDPLKEPGPKPYHPPEDTSRLGSFDTKPPGHGYAPPDWSPHTGLGPLPNPYAVHHPWKLRSPGRMIGGKPTWDPLKKPGTDYRPGGGKRHAPGDHTTECPLHGEAWFAKDCLLGCEYYDSDAGLESSYCSIKHKRRMKELREEEARLEADRARLEAEVAEREAELARERTEMEAEMAEWRRQMEERGRKSAEEDRGRDAAELAEWEELKRRLAEFWGDCYDCGHPLDHCRCRPDEDDDSDDAIDGYLPGVYFQE